MNNKYLSLLMICLLGFILCMGTVCAKESMKTKKFDNFQMDVSKDSNLVKLDDGDLNEEQDIPISVEAYGDDKNFLLVEYVEGPLFSTENNAAIYQGLFSSLNQDLNESYEYQEDNLRIIEPVSKSNMYFSLVGLSSDNATLVIMGQDVSLLKEMGHSVKFN